MNDIWLIGAGPMAIEYARVLKALEKDFITVGRGENSALKFFESTGHKPVVGGIESFLSSKPAKPECAIIAVGIETLAETCVKVLDYGVKKILLEKPGVAYPSEIEQLSNQTRKNNATVVLAYNRRFYASVLKAKEIIRADGGVQSFNFEFTEWSHIIRTLKKHSAEHHNWFLGNSTHVVDTAFFLGGTPKEFCCFVKGGLDWHPASSNFAGAGISESGALFSYQANWGAPGRWVLEILTAQYRLIFKPMETLQIQKIGSVAIEPVQIDDSLDKQFKAGVYLQTKAFLQGEYANFCDVLEQKENIEKYYLKMSGYTMNA